MNRYKHFFSNNLDLSCIASLDGYFEEINENFIKVLEYSIDDLLGTRFFEFIHPDDIDSTKREVEKLGLGMHTVNFINRYKTKSGKYINLKWNAQVNAETKKIQAIARDVTEKIIADKDKETRATELIIANKELIYQNEEKENRASELAIANKELIYQNKLKEKRAAELIVANKELAYQNEEKEKRASELAVANRELIHQNELKEKRAAELVIANKELAYQNEEKENRASELAIANEELIYQNKLKEKRAGELIIANKELAYQNEEKEKRAAELVVTNKELEKAKNDYSKLNQELEQKVIERTIELELTNKELEGFSYSVSHDLRAPIRAISGYSKILEEDYSEMLDSAGLVSLKAIRNNSKRMGELIDDLLAFSRLGRKQLSVAGINMNILVNSVKEESVKANSNQNIEFNVSELLPAKGDQSLIRQVWINLISNAIKYSKNTPKTIIEIGSYQEDRLIIYYVKDNGAGFNMEYYDKLFGVFQRLHSQKEFEGTGIGLAIVQKLINRHNGKVWAESVLNTETSFYFSLPIN